MTAKPKSLDIREPYRIEHIVIDAGNVHIFRLLEHARPLDDGRVAHLHGALIKGEHFDTPMAVNRLADDHGKRYRLIDGGHRLEAIKRFINQNPGAKVSMAVFLYDNLSEAEEREIFRRWNSGKQQSLSDWIYLNQDALRIYKRIMMSFPFKVHIYPLKTKDDGLRFGNLMRAYLSWMNVHGENGDKAQLIERIRRLGDDDYAKLCAFASTFLDAFGVPCTGNPFSKRVPLESLTKTYFFNEKSHSQADIVDAWKRVRTDKDCAQWAKMGNSAQLGTITSLFIETMNRRRRTNVFVGPSLREESPRMADGRSIREMRTEPLVMEERGPAPKGGKDAKRVPHREDTSP